MNTIRLRGKIKGFFCLLKLHRLIPSKVFGFMSHISDMSKWISENKKGSYNDFYTYRFDYLKREELYEFIIKDQDLNENIDYLEFGVAGGNSLRWWLSRIDNRDARFFGFDTFSGLPENWGPFKKGDMSTGNKPPEINDQRCSLYQGLFQQTLIPFLLDYKSGRRKVIHMDADLYSATLYVLTTVSPYLRPGDILLFDEFNVPLHEFKAFKDWSSAFYIRYRVLGGVNNFYQTAFLLE